MHDANQKFHKQSEAAIDHTHFIFAIKDEAAQGFGPPIIDTNKSMYYRRLQQVLLDGNNPASKYPSDHTVWELGRFDYRTGQITPYEKPVLIAQCAQLKETFESMKN